LVRRLKNFVLPDQRWSEKLYKNTTFYSERSTSSLWKDMIHEFMPCIFALNSTNMTLIKSSCLYKAKKSVD